MAGTEQNGAASFKPEGLKVLVIDPNEAERTIAEKSLQALNYQTSACECIPIAQSRLREFDVLLVDVTASTSWLNGNSQEYTALTQSKVPLVLTAKNPSPSLVMTGISKLGAVDFLEKPLSYLKLKNIWQHKIRRMLSSSSGAVCGDPALRPLLRRCQSSALDTSAGTADEAMSPTSRRNRSRTSMTEDRRQSGENNRKDTGSPSQAANQQGFEASPRARTPRRVLRSTTKAVLQADVTASAPASQQQLGPYTDRSTQRAAAPVTAGNSDKNQENSNSSLVNVNSQGNASSQGAVGFESNASTSDALLDTPLIDNTGGLLRTDSLHITGLTNDMSHLLVEETLLVPSRCSQPADMEVGMTGASGVAGGGDAVHVAPRRCVSAMLPGEARAPAMGHSAGKLPALPSDVPGITWGLPVSPWPVSPVSASPQRPGCMSPSPMFPFMMMGMNGMQGMNGMHGMPFSMMGMQFPFFSSGGPNSGMMPAQDSGGNMNMGLNINMHMMPMMAGISAQYMGSMPGMGSNTGISHASSAGNAAGYSADMGIARPSTTPPMGTLGSTQTGHITSTRDLRTGGKSLLQSQPHADKDDVLIEATNSPRLSVTQAALLQAGDFLDMTDDALDALNPLSDALLGASMLFNADEVVEESALDSRAGESHAAAASTAHAAGKDPAAIAGPSTVVQNNNEWYMLSSQKEYDTAGLLNGDSGPEAVFGSTAMLHKTSSLMDVIMALDASGTGTLPASGFFDGIDT